jgi:hypothetical protein
MIVVPIHYFIQFPDLQVVPETACPEYTESYGSMQVEGSLSPTSDNRTHQNKGNSHVPSIDEEVCD